MTPMKAHGWVLMVLTGMLCSWLTFVLLHGVFGVDQGIAWVAELAVGGIIGWHWPRRRFAR